LQSRPGRADSQEVGTRPARRRLARLSAALGLLAAAACGAGDPPRRGPAASPGPEIVARGRRATGIVTSGLCRGSGFFIAPTLAVTNAHVLCADAASIRVDDREIPAEFEHIDDELDVAVLRTEDITPTITPLSTASALEVRAGDVLTAIGAPADAGEAVTAVSGPAAGSLTSLWGVLHVEADLPLSPGNSGGPLVDAQGRVVAVVSKRRVKSGRVSGLGVPIDYLAASLPVGIAARGKDWPARVEAAIARAAPAFDRFDGARRRPILLGAHYLSAAVANGAPDREVLVVVVAAPARTGVTEVTLRLTCGDIRPASTRLSPWLAVDQPLERSIRIDVTPLRPFLAWARQRGVASEVALATGDASALGAPVECPGRRLTLLDSGTETDSIVIE
jgi:S1-C subfamily serine protease